MNGRARRWLGALFGLALLGISPPARAQAHAVRVVRGMQVSGGDGAAEIVLYLFAPARERTHRPASEGQVIEIDLEPLAIGRAAPDPSASPQIVPFGGDASLPLIEVAASVRADGTPVLSLRFRESVRFEVAQPRDLDRLVVRVYPGSSSAAETRIEALMRSGRDALTRGDFPAAIRIFTTVQDLPAGPHSPDAKELLGLARQKNGQLAHAKAEYEDYLARYPTSDGAERVRQRLDALVTAARAATEPKPERGPESARRDDARGGGVSFDGTLAQTFWWDQFEVGPDPEPTNTSYLISDIFMSARTEGGVRTLGTTVSAGQLQGFGETESESRVSSAFFEAVDRERGATLRLGRQPGSSGGVLGRFDGARLGYRTGAWSRFELVSGFPVVLTDSNRIHSARPFGGLSVELGPFRDAWTLQPFAIYQQIDGIEDRSAVGAELRFNDPTRSLLALADYDFGYAKLNTIFVVGSWYAANGTSVNALVDYRTSPILTTSNALIATGMEEIDELRDLLSESEIRELAEDRTATAKTFSLGASHELTPHLRLSLDATASNVSSTDTSNGLPLTLPDGTPFDTIERVPGTDFEYTVSSYLSGTDWLMSGDFSSIGLGHLAGQVSDRTWLVLSGRYPVIGTLRAGPRVVFEYRKPDAADSAVGVKPSLRLDLRWRRFTFEAEGGVEWIRDRGEEQLADQSRYYFALGWRWDF